MKKYFVIAAAFLIMFSVVGCTQTVEKKESTSTKDFSPVVVEPEPVEFTGEEGETLSLINEQVEIEPSLFDDTSVIYYNLDLDGTIIYFFVVKDKNDVYRVAANACQVCADSKMGFRHEGNFMVCNTCGNKYPLEKISTEKGGCNPVPISQDLSVVGGKLIIEKSDLMQVVNYFK